MKILATIRKGINGDVCFALLPVLLFAALFDMIFLALDILELSVFISEVFELFSTLSTDGEFSNSVFSEL